MAVGDRREGGRRPGFLARYLASRAGARYLLKIKAAKDWGLLPTSLILGKRKRTTPTRWDLALAEAEQILEMERCPQCGNPRYVCQSDDNDIDFRVYDETCNAMRKKAQYEKRKEGEKGREGVIVGIESFTHSDTPLDLFREPFYMAKSEKAKKREALRPRIPRDAPPGQTPKPDDQ